MGCWSGEVLINKPVIRVRIVTEFVNYRVFQGLSSRMNVIAQKSFPHPVRSAGPQATFSQLLHLNYGQ